MITEEQIKRLEQELAEMNGESRRAAKTVFFDTNIQDDDGIITIKAVSCLGGTLNNWNELIPVEVLKSNSGKSDIIIDVAHSADFLKVLDFDGVLSIETVRAGDIFSLLPKNLTADDNLQALVVTFTVRRDTHPEYYNLAKAGRLKHFSTTAYQKASLAINPFSEYGDEKSKDLFRKYSKEIVGIDKINLPHFLVITSIDIWGVSPELYPSQRGAKALEITAREAKEEKSVLDVLFGIETIF